MKLSFKFSLSLFELILKIRVSLFELILKIEVYSISGNRDEGSSLATFYSLVMDQNLRNLDASESNKDTTAPRTNTNTCDQCNYASSKIDNFKRHMKSHSGEKSNKCDQCD